MSSRFEKFVVDILIVAVLVQPVGLVSVAYAETVEMEYSDPDHLHAPHQVNIDGQESTYQYDANGNLVNDEERVISWNQDNLPTRIEKDGEVIEFFYDADGRRVVKRFGENKTVYINDYYQQSTISNPPAQTLDILIFLWYCSG